MARPRRRASSQASSEDLYRVTPSPPPQRTPTSAPRAQRPRSRSPARSPRAGPSTYRVRGALTQTSRQPTSGSSTRLGEHGTPLGTGHGLLIPGYATAAARAVLNARQSPGDWYRQRSQALSSSRALPSRRETAQASEPVQQPRSGSQPFPHRVLPPLQQLRPASEPGPGPSYRPPAPQRAQTFPGPRLAPLAPEVLSQHPPPGPAQEPVANVVAPNVVAPHAPSQQQRYPTRPAGQQSHIPLPSVAPAQGQHHERFGQDSREERDPPTSLYMGWTAVERRMDARNRSRPNSLRNKSQSPYHDATGQVAWDRANRPLERYEVWAQRHHGRLAEWDIRWMWYYFTGTSAPWNDHDGDSVRYF